MGEDGFRSAGTDSGRRVRISALEAGRVRLADRWQPGGSHTVSRKVCRCQRCRATIKLYAWCSREFDRDACRAERHCGANYRCTSQYNSSESSRNAHNFKRKCNCSGGSGTARESGGNSSGSGTDGNGFAEFTQVNPSIDSISNGLAGEFRARRRNAEYSVCS